MCLTQIIKELNGGNCHSKKNWMCTFYMAPFLSFSLHSGRATNYSPCNRLLFRTVFDHTSKPQSTSPRKGWKICPFPLFGLPSICIFITHLCYDSALVNRKGCKVNILGTQGMSPWIKLHLGNGVGMGEHSTQWIPVHQQCAIYWQ